jgi:hypothetical protein
VKVDLFWNLVSSPWRVKSKNQLLLTIVSIVSVFWVLMFCAFINFSSKLVVVNFEMWEIMLSSHFIMMLLFCHCPRIYVVV